jgi:hypothetical protein
MVTEAGAPLSESSSASTASPEHDPINAHTAAVQSPSTSTYPAESNHNGLVSVRKA